jgi:trimethylamine:corrinoid methyltransferase-like protein
MEPREITARAGLLLEKRLAEYEKPEIDTELEKRLVRYVKERKQDL